MFIITILLPHYVYIGVSVDHLVNISTTYSNVSLISRGKTYVSPISSIYLIANILSYQSYTSSCYGYPIHNSYHFKM